MTSPTKAYNNNAVNPSGRKANGTNSRKEKTSKRRTTAQQDGYEVEINGGGGDANFPSLSVNNGHEEAPVGVSVVATAASASSTKSKVTKSNGKTATASVGEIKKWSEVVSGGEKSTDSASQYHENQQQQQQRSYSAYQQENDEAAAKIASSETRINEKFHPHNYNNSYVHYDNSGMPFESNLNKISPIK